MNPTKLIRSIFAKRLSQIDRYADYGDIIQQKTPNLEQNSNSTTYPPIKALPKIFPSMDMKN